MSSIIIREGNSSMKNKIAITIIGLTVVLSIVACGNKDSLAEPTETNSIVEDSETIDTEVTTTENIEVTEVQESETEVSDEVADIIVQLEELGYNNIDVDLIEHLILSSYDPLYTGVLENFETAEFGATLPGDGTVDEKLRDWVKSQGADYMSGWTIVFEHGKGAGNQPTYGIYMRPDHIRQGERFVVGDYLPSGTQLTGTWEEYEAWMAQHLKDFIMETGVEGEDYEIEDDGTFVIIID